MQDLTTRIKMALLIMLITFFYIFCVTFFDLPATGLEVSKMVVPFLLGTVIGTLINFYYGNKHEEKPPIDKGAIEAAKAKEVIKETKKELKLQRRK